MSSGATVDDLIKRYFHARCGRNHRASCTTTPIQPSNSTRTDPAYRATCPLSGPYEARQRSRRELRSLDGRGRCQFLTLSNAITLRRTGHPSRVLSGQSMSAFVSACRLSIPERRTLASFMARSSQAPDRGMSTVGRPLDLARFATDAGVLRGDRRCGQPPAALRTGPCRAPHAELLASVCKPIISGKVVELGFRPDGGTRGRGKRRAPCRSVALGVHDANPCRPAEPRQTAVSQSIGAGAQ